MKKFIQNVIAMSIIILLLFIVIEFLLLLRTNTYAYKRTYVEEHIDDIQVLLCGNSHIEFALKPDLIGEGSFNLAISGRKTIYDVELAKRYVPQMKSLKALIMPLDYFGFYFGRARSNPRDREKDDTFMSSTYKCMYYKYMGIRVDSPWYWSEFINSKLDFMSRFWRTDKDIRECDSLGYNRRELANRRVGWAYHSLPKLVDMAKASNMAEYNRHYQYYRTLAQLSQQRGVRLVLLGTPMYKTYQEAMNKELELEILAFVKDLQEEYPNVEYYDFSHDERFEPDDFYNASHLTEQGAAKFSKILAEIVNALSAQ